MNRTARPKFEKEFYERIDVIQSKIVALTTRTKQEFGVEKGNFYATTNRGQTRL